MLVVVEVDVQVGGEGVGDQRETEGDDNADEVLAVVDRRGLLDLRSPHAVVSLVGTLLANQRHAVVDRDALRLLTGDDVGRHFAQVGN